jgi:ABC-type multidrug transport system fused ATPase/permease subunit
MKLVSPSIYRGAYTLLIMADLKIYSEILKKYLLKESSYIFAGIILGIISQTCTLSTPFITKILIDNVILKKNLSALISLLIISVAILILLLATSLGANYILIRVFKKSSAKIKMELFRKLQVAPLQFFEKNLSGEISYRLLQDTEIIENSWSSLLVTIPLQIILLISGIFMVLWHLKLSLFVFLILFLQIIIIVKFRKPLLRFSHFYKSKEQELTGFVVSHFRRIQLVRSLSTEKKEQLNFLNKLHELIKIIVRLFMLTKFSSTMVTVVNNLWAFGILCYGGWLVISDKISLGTLMAFLLFSNILYQPISTITNFVLSFQDVRASLRRLHEYLNLKSEVIESPDAEKFIPGEGRIEIKDVSFAYNSQIVLEKINLTIVPNSIFALVGKSGAGKTTLCKLLVRFYDPDEGSIFLDGKNIRNIKLSSLRRSVLLMLQNEYVFPGTVWENITYGLDFPVKKDIADAMEKAAVDFLKNLPAGFQTIIGEEGINLSSGEAQRIALARAFLISPKVLILDEPTSFIDRETEEKIKNALLKLKEKSTIILIAHRLSTVKIADLIGVLERGKIVEIGTYDELMKKENGVFKRIYSSILL